MTEEYQRGFADAKDAIGKLIACASASLAGMTLIAEVGGKDDDAKAGKAVTTAMNMIVEEIDKITPETAS